MNTDKYISTETADAINRAVATCHQLSREKGWWPAPYVVANMSPEERSTLVAARLALIHSEVSEALEDLREHETPLDLQRTGELSGGKPFGFPSEIADVVIRCFDLAGALGIDLGEAIRTKHAFNHERAFRHGGKTL